jgi:hypothetical protein
MRIRQEQMQALDEAMLRDFEARAMAHLRRCFPDRLASTENSNLLPWIERAIARAREYGVKTENDVLRYLEFEAQYGPDFDKKFAAAQKILVRDDLDATGKLDQLDNWEMFVRPEPA